MKKEKAKVIKKVGTITAEEIATSWFSYSVDGHIKWANNALILGLKRSAALVGGNIGESCYIPHKLNLETRDIDVYEADFMVMGLDPNIKLPLQARETKG